MAKRVKQQRPPILSRLLIFLLTPGEDLEAVMGDLEEEFRHRTIAYSLAEAWVWHWHQSITSIPYWLVSKRHAGAMAMAGLLISGYSLIMCWDFWIAMV